jgi:predicted permease
MPAFLQDLRYAVRLLAKDRSFTITALVTLAVCIAANTVIFGIVRSVLFKPLPIPDAGELVMVYNSYPHAGYPRAATAVPDYFDRLVEVPALADQALFQRTDVTFGGDRGAEQVIGLRVTPSFFTLARMQPVEGRVFRAEEGQPGSDGQAILAHGFWQRAFGGDRSVVGSTIRIDGRSRTVVGIAPAEFTFVWDDIDLFVPAAFTAEDKSFERRHSNNWQMVGRIAPGSSLFEAQQQVDALNAANNERFPEFRQILEDAGFRSVVVYLQDDVVRDVEAVLYLLWGGVLFVLVIGCVNIANLVLVRSSARARELATRHAIGADLGRLARQLLTETTLLSLSGGVLGLVLGFWAVRWVGALNLSQLPRSHEIALDPAGAATMLAISGCVGVVLGLVPAVRLRRMNLNLQLREESRGGTSGRRAQVARRVLATAQIAIAFVLLIGAGLMLSSFRAVLGLDLGFAPERVHAAHVTLPPADYPDGAARKAFFERALEAVQAIPEVETAGATNTLPFTGDHNDSVILAEGYEMKPGESLISPTLNIVTPGYFESMQVDLVDGRLFEQVDTTGTVPVIVIDDRLARRFFQDGKAVGRRFYFPTTLEDITAITDETVFMTVVGVIREIRVDDPRAENAPVGAYYLPLTGRGRQAPDTMAITMRVRASSDSLMAQVQRAIASIDPDLPVYRTGSMEDWIDRTLVSRRVPMYLALAFGAVGLFLSAIGIYGVLAYGVAERRRELGVRMALGGSASQVFNMVLGDGLRITAIGLAVGLAGSLAVGRVMESQLFGVSTVEPAVLALVAMALAGVALAASVIPSWRATRINPVTVLGK